jgi:hypothetical protein
MSRTSGVIDGKFVILSNIEKMKPLSTIKPGFDLLNSTLCDALLCLLDESQKAWIVLHLDSLEQRPLLATRTAKRPRNVHRQVIRKSGPPLGQGK